MFNPEASLVVSVVTQNVGGSCGLSVTKDWLLAVVACYQHAVKVSRYKYKLLSLRIDIILDNMSGGNPESQVVKNVSTFFNQETKRYKPSSVLELDGD